MNVLTDDTAIKLMLRGRLRRNACQRRDATADDLRLINAMREASREAGPGTPIRRGCGRDPLATPAMAALRQRLAKPTPRTIAETIRRKDPTPACPFTTPAPSGKVDRRSTATGRTLHTIHLREFDMADGRKLLIDRRSIAFIARQSRGHRQADHGHRLPNQRAGLPGGLPGR
jgi:hypothetical protein